MKFYNVLPAIVLSLIAISCDNNDGDRNNPINNSLEVNKSGVLSTDETWSGDSIYVLNGRVVVPEGVELTIEPGTIIKGKEGDGANASTLIIAQGGMIDAQGTESAPIIMTSILDNITVGEQAGTNLDETDAGLWGGLIVLGYAPISADAATALIEGLPANEAYAVYGGTNAADNSGSIEYVSVRHGGTLIGDGNEINGITLAGVGSATVVNHIEVVANVDDGVEFFGGSVNASNIVVWAQGDDAYDIDQAYSGTIDNFVYIAGPDSDHGMEVDGPEGATGAGFTATNGTLYGMSAEIADFRDSAMGNVQNIYITGFNDAGDWEIDETGGAYNFENGLLNFSSIEIDMTNYTAGKTVAEVFMDKSGAVSAWDPTTFATVVTAPTVGADESKLSWTYASMKGAF
ncbi:MAG: hypothetical protein CMP53_01515 [Flavobacteriales bacterium]|nr:hypothetical protein [Flavobacteriales bacterium]